MICTLPPESISILIKSILLSHSQPELSYSHVLFICEIDEYQNSHDINPNPISLMLEQNRSFPSNHTLLWSTSLQPFAIVALQRSKYQFTKYPNCICRNLWCAPVVPVIAFFKWRKCYQFSIFANYFCKTNYLFCLTSTKSTRVSTKRVFSIINSTFHISHRKKLKKSAVCNISIDTTDSKVSSPSC